MKYRFVITAVMGVSASALMLTTGCGTTRTYEIPYSTAESMLLDRLDLDANQMIADSPQCQARAGNDLARSMSKKLFAVAMNEHSSGTELSFTCLHRYDIGAVGGQYIRFDLRKLTTETTKITADYSDRWWGMWPPFVFWNPGLFRERDIHNTIWGKKSACLEPECKEDATTPRQLTLNRMKKIVIDNVEYRQANLSDVLDYIVKSSRECESVSQDARTVGLELCLSGSTNLQPKVQGNPFAAGTRSEPKDVEITFSARHISLYSLMNIVCKISDLKWSIDEKGQIRIKAKDCSRRCGE